MHSTPSKDIFTVIDVAGQFSDSDPDADYQASEDASQTSPVLGAPTEEDSTENSETEDADPPLQLDEL